MRSATAWMVALGLVLAGCSSSAESPSDPPRASLEPTTDANAPPTTVGTAAAKDAVLQQILGTGAPDGWTVASAYDLGAILIATLKRGGDAQPITALSVAESDAGFSADELAAAFGGAESTSHPLEVLGYDLVQPRGASVLILDGRTLPRIDYAWLRVEPDSGQRENGSGSAIWMHCGAQEPTARNGRFVMLNSEMPSGHYDADRLLSFVGGLDLCSVR